jgi:hypothetical protein
MSILKFLFVPRVVNSTPSLFGRVTQETTRRPFVVGNPVDIFEEAFVGRGGVRQALALPVFQEVSPNTLISPIGFWEIALNARAR